MLLRPTMSAAHSGVLVAVVVVAVSCEANICTVAPAPLRHSRRGPPASGHGLLGFVVVVVVVVPRRYHLPFEGHSRPVRTGPWCLPVGSHRRCSCAGCASTSTCRLFLSIRSSVSTVRLTSSFCQHGMDFNIYSIPVNGSATALFGA